MKFYLLAIMLLILSGCSSQYVVTYDSSPQGASLVCSGKNWGYTPKKLYYDESVKKQETINVSDCSANWVSGARKSYPSNLKVFPQGGTIISLDRPRGDGYSQDAEFALKVQQMKNQNAQAQAAADAKAWSDLNQAIKDATPKTTNTNCYNTYGGINCNSTTY